MPSWWRGKSKSKPSSPAIAAGAAAPAKKPLRRSTNIPDKLKANSFDVAAGAAATSLFAFDHPLPRPSLSLPLSTAANAGSGSSGSSSTSGDEVPDLGFYRYSVTVPLASARSLPNDVEHLRLPAISVSPRREFPLYVGEVSHTVPTSPTQQRSVPGSPTGRRDDLRSSAHPLPLPPGSPTSSGLWRGQWKKGKLLGRGTFGHVYLGFNSDSGQMAAIKEVKVISDDSNSKECLKQLNQEINLLSQLSHPNIVRYYGSLLEEGTLSVYLEYVSGGSIHKLLQEYGPFREPLIRNYTAQILSGLAYLHGRNTVHRDIKGANILVDPLGEIKLVDFGMAKHMSSYTSVRSFKGSPYWMAPEIIMNSSGYNLSVDIWSLGCTILEMATSKPPWSHFEGVAAIFKIGNSKDIPDIPDDISSEGKAFLKLCLQRDPSARPTAAQLMEHPFVRDQATIKAGKLNLIRDAFPSSYDSSHTVIATDLASSRPVSKLRGQGLRLETEYPDAYKTKSGMVNTRMNMSLPVSPCSSPLRQFRQTNRSCLPSPTHPAFSAGAVNYSPSNYMLYPMRSCNNLQDPWSDSAPLRVCSPYNSPRR